MANISRINGNVIISGLSYSDRTTIPDGSNLNSYRSEGHYKISSGSSAATIGNVPDITTGGMLIVLSTIDNDFIMQFYVVTGTEPQKYYTRRYRNSWGDWSRVAVGKNSITDDMLASSGGVLDTIDGINTEIGRIDKQMGKYDGVASIDKSDKVHGSPFYRVHFLPSTVKKYVYSYDESTQQYSRVRLLSSFGEYMHCPRYLGFNIPSGSARMYLYIGELVDGEFVLDEDYVFNVTSANDVNYLNSGHSRMLEIPDGKVFYYNLLGNESGELPELIGCDNWPESDIEVNSHSEYFVNASGSAIVAGAADYGSKLIPAGHFFAVRPLSDGYISYYSSVVRDTETSGMTQRVPKSFGYVSTDDGFGMLMPVGSGYDMNEFDVYVKADVESHCVGGASRMSESLARETIEKFVWRAKVTLPWSDSTNKFTAGDKRHYGIPYASRWVDAHNVCLEVSPETALNAANDEYSIFYDTTPRRTAIGSRGGTGYGLVCSTFSCLWQGNDYPQSNNGFTWDGNFQLTRTNSLHVGSILSDIVGHCVGVAEVFDNGYSLYEGISPLCGKSIHAGGDDYRFRASVTALRYLDDYGYEIQSIVRGGFGDSNRVYRDYDFELANGSVRPWRGNKCVYGPFDKTSGGLGIGITIHDGASIAYVVKPSGNVVSVDVSGNTYVDIADIVDEDGTYELYSDVSSVREYFRYREHDDVTFTLTPDGIATFSSSDVDYCYASSDALQDDFSYMGDTGGALCIANTAKYPASRYAGLAPHITNVRAAMVYDEWGRYAVPCAFDGETPSNAHYMTTDEVLALYEQ